MLACADWYSTPSFASDALPSQFVPQLTYYPTAPTFLTW